MRRGRGLESERHRELVQRYLDRGYKKRGFERAIAAHMAGVTVVPKRHTNACRAIPENEPRDGTVCAACEYRAVKREWKIGLVPDAYRVWRDEYDSLHVEAVEVEVTTPLTRERIEKYTKLWFYLDCEGCFLEVIQVDTTGTERRGLTEEAFTDLFYHSVLPPSHPEAHK